MIANIFVQGWIQRSLSSWLCSECSTKEYCALSFTIEQKHVWYHTANGKQTTVQVGLTVKKQLLPAAAEVCACVCVCWRRRGAAGWRAEGAAVRTQTVGFLHALIRTNVPQNHDPLKTNLPYPDKDLVIKTGLCQKVLRRIEGSCWQNTALVSSKS